MDGLRSSDDKAFQAAGPDVENARDVSVLGTTNYTPAIQVMPPCFMSSDDYHGHCIFNYSQHQVNREKL